MKQTARSADRREGARKVNRIAGGGRDPSGRPPYPTNGTRDPCLPSRCKPGRSRAQGRDRAGPDRENRSEYVRASEVFPITPYPQPRRAILRGPAINLLAVCNSATASGYIPLSNISDAKTLVRQTETGLETKGALELVIASS